MCSMLLRPPRDWTDRVIEKGGGSGGRKVKTRVLVMKYNENDNLPYCAEYLSVNSG